MAAINYTLDGHIYLELTKEEIEEALSRNGSIQLEPDEAEAIGGDAGLAVEEHKEFSHA